MQINVIILLMVSVISADELYKLQTKSTCVPDSHHNLTNGTCIDDRMILVYRSKFQIGAITQPSPAAFIWSKNIDGGSYIPYPIQCIRIIDLVENNEGGCPSIVLGGAGQTNADLQFVSQVGKKIHFLIEIYMQE